MMHLNQRFSRACIVHLVIKRTDWCYVKTMSCSGSHLGITINIKNAKFVKDLPMIDAQFRYRLLRTSGLNALYLTDSYQITILINTLT
jgi:hypothetical protein